MKNVRTLKEINLKVPSSFLIPKDLKQGNNNNKRYHVLFCHLVMSSANRYYHSFSLSVHIPSCANH